MDLSPLVALGPSSALRLGGGTVTPGDRRRDFLGKGMLRSLSLEPAPEGLRKNPLGGQSPTDQCHSLIVQGILKRKGYRGVEYEWTLLIRGCISLLVSDAF